MDRLTQASLLKDLASADMDCETLDRQPFAPPSNGMPPVHERLARIVGAIESDIIPRLVRAHREATAAPPAAVDGRVEPADVAGFVAAILADEDTGWQDALQRLREMRVPIDAIYLDLLAPVARALGQQWEDDRVSFSEVTIGLGRLQRVMRVLSPAFRREVGQPADGRRVLLLPAPGEQHTFGLSIVAEFFRREGWEVVGDTDERTADPAALVRSEWFDVIGISVAVDSRLDWLRSGIAAVRAASRNRAIGVLVGGPAMVQDPTRAEAVGADGTAVDGREAPRVAERLLEERQRRLP
jgi:methanogenic corrinoid protein MtbC1